MNIIKVTEDETRKPIYHFDDGTKVWFLRPESNHNQPGPGVENAPSFRGHEYIQFAFSFMRRMNELKVAAHHTENEVLNIDAMATLEDNCPHCGGLVFVNAHQATCQKCGRMARI